MTSRRTRKLTTTEITLAALLLWGLLSPHLGCTS
jgi:hypothetical protein